MIEQQGLFRIVAEPGGRIELTPETRAGVALSPGSARELAEALTRAAEEAEKPREIKVLTPTDRYLVMRVPYVGGVEINGYERDGTRVDRWLFRTQAVKDFIVEAGGLLRDQV